MPRAAVLFRSTVSYRRDAFAAGLSRLGYSVEDRPTRAPREGDVLVIWNRRGAEDILAKGYERVGGRVVVAENGYIGKDAAGGKLFALALGHHNGAGAWPEGEPQRFESFGVQLAPWRTNASRGHILLLPQRGIGIPGTAMPSGWLGTAMKQLQRMTERELRIRRHPGSDKTEPYDALAGAHAAVTWGSGAAIKALAAGVPVFAEFRKWIGAGAAAIFPGHKIEEPVMDDEARLAMFRRLAWAQWRLAEIETGEAFAWLLKQ